MIRDRIRRRLNRQSRIPFHMFDAGSVADEAAAARKLERLYHRGQERAWAGTEVLTALAEEHGPSRLDAEGRAALREVLGGILWGELIAWKVAAKLADEAVPLEIKLAATSQAHDESRHFYVLHDFLERVGGAPMRLPKSAERLFERVLAADTMAKRILGMHLVVEPMAQSIFHLLREREVDPVLSELMPLFERDEARHVALGVLYLPQLLAEARPRELAALATWQLRTYLMQLDVLRDTAPALAALGVDARVAYRQGRKRQLAAMRLVGDELGRTLPVTELFVRVIDFKSELDFPDDARIALGARLKNATRVALRGRAAAAPA